MLTGCVCGRVGIAGREQKGWLKGWLVEQKGWLNDEVADASLDKERRKKKLRGAKVSPLPVSCAWP